MKLKNSWEKAFFILFNAITILIFLSYLYDDFYITQRHGVEFWNACFFHGGPLKFYSYVAENTISLAMYDFTIYLIFAVWNIPCWIYELITGADSQNVVILMIYAKSLILVSYYLSIYFLKKLYDDIVRITGEQSFLTDYDVLAYYASSVLLTIYSVYTGNYDIFSLAIIIAGIDALINDKIGKFILLFAIATSLKYFAIWIFVPLILIKEKRIHRIVLSLVACYSISFVENIVFGKNAVFAEYGDMGFSAAERLKQILGAGEISIFENGIFSLSFLLYSLLCIYCYLISPSGKKLIDNILYVSLLAWAIFFFIVFFNCYWIILMVPFLALITVRNKENLYINVILEFIFSLTMLGNCMIRQAWVVGGINGFSTHLALESFLAKALNLFIPPVGTIGNKMMEHDSWYGLGLYIYSTMVASFIAFAVINIPSDRLQSLIPKLKSPILNEKAVMMVRNMLCLCVYVVPTLYYLYQIIANN